MRYRIYPQKDSVKFYAEPHSKSKLPYYPAKEMREKYPSGNYVIIGEIGSFARPPTDGDKLLMEGGKEIPILPRGSLKKPIEWIAGYIAVGNNIYVAVVRGIFSAFLRR